MTLLLAATSFVLGAVLASFAGVAAGRLYTGQSIVRGRSRCDRCGATLGTADLIPVFSYLFSCGRARCCGARCSSIAPVSELLLGALFVLAYLRLGPTLTLALLMGLLTLLTVLVLYDLAHQILPPLVLGIFLLMAFCFAYLQAPSVSAFYGVLAFALTFALFFALLWGLSGGRAMGLSDSPLVAGLALVAGPFAFVGFLLSFWIGAAVGIVLLVMPSASATMKSEVPFAPFLALGFLLAYFTQWDPFSVTLTVTELIGMGLP